MRLLPAPLRRSLIPVSLACAAWLSAASAAAPVAARTWMADNGNGTFTNPLFYDEFSDPDLIRVGDDFYLTGTTMHAMPGLPVLQSRDLVNWRFVSYASEGLDLGAEYRLEDGEIYGQGIWAPCFRYHDGTYIIFTNVNGRTTQVFRATNPAGPWTRSEMRRSLHDLSVLFDDDGRIYVVWGYNEIRFAELEPDLSDIKPGTEKVAIPAGSGMGEGAHFYKIDGRYFIISANYDPMGYMVCARADRPDGPYEVAVISARETLGVSTGWRLRGQGRTGPEVVLDSPRDNFAGAIPMHQGGIVQTPAGEWWGFSMMDHNSIGRLTCLSPVTWVDGWPYFGLPGNLTRSPRTWRKPATTQPSEPRAPYRRSDEFAEPDLQPVWQWNHVPDDTAWSLTDAPGALRLYPRIADSFWTARNSLTQRAVGPESIATVEMDGSGLGIGDIAGLALLNHPYAWIGLARTADGLRLEQFDELTGDRVSVSAPGSRVHLRVRCDFDQELAQFSYLDAAGDFQSLGKPFRMVFQLKTFQGVRFALFGFNRGRQAGGHVDFLTFTVDEPQADRSQTIPVGQTITLTSLGDDSRLVSWNGVLRPMPGDSAAAQGTAARFRVLDRGEGRVALEAADGSGFVTVTGHGVTGDVRLTRTEAGAASMFMWQDMLHGDFMLLSLHTNRHLAIAPHTGELASADSPGAAPNRKAGACFRWSH